MYGDSFEPAWPTCLSGETYFSLVWWQEKSLHKCFNITNKNELCSNFPCHQDVTVWALRSLTHSVKHSVLGWCSINLLKSHRVGFKKFATLWCRILLSHFLLKKQFSPQGRDQNSSKGNLQVILVSCPRILRLLLWLCSSRAEGLGCMVQGLTCALES